MRSSPLLRISLFATMLGSPACAAPAGEQGVTPPAGDTAASTDSASPVSPDVTFAALDPASAVMEGASAFTGRYVLTAPCRVSVEALTDKKGRRTHAAWDWVLTPDGTGVRLTTENYAMVSMDPPLDAQQQRLLEAVTGQIPAMRVTADGTYEGLAGDMEAFMRDFLDAVDQSMEGSVADDVRAQTREQLRQTMLSPQALAAIDQGAAKDWNATFGLWTHRTFSPGAPVESVETVDNANGAFPVKMRLSHHGVLPDTGGKILLQYEGISEGPEFEATVAANLSSLIPKDAPASSAAEVAKAVQGMRSVMEVMAVFDPATGLPHRIRVEDRVDNPNAAEPRQPTVKDRVFHWDRADGCLATSE